MTTPPPEKRGFRFVFLLPLVLFAGLFVLFALRINGGGDPALLPSVLIGRSAPDFALPALPGTDRPALARADLAGHGVTLLNVFASWCAPCHDEHPVLVEIAHDSRFHLVGIDYKDQNADALAFLTRNGNPYAAIGVDAGGRTGIDFGVYGVPETFVIDAKGVVRYKFVGPLTMDSYTKTLLPEILKAAG